MTPTDVSASLAGTWRLRSWESVAEDGSVAQPLGKEPQGILVYASDGTMITVIGRRGRPPLDTDDPLHGAPVGRLAAAETFIAYAGRFTFDGRHVRHTVEMSLFPNWVGTTQERRVELDREGARLVLTSPPFALRGAVRTHRLVWERDVGGDLPSEGGGSPDFAAQSSRDS